MEEIQPKQFDESQHKKNIKNLVLSVIIFILITALIVGGGIYWWQKSIFKVQQEQMQQKIDDLERQIADNKKVENITSTSQILDNKYIKFRDDVLGIEFYYPKEWGTISGQLSGSEKKTGDEYGGYAYNFTFNGHQVGGSALGYGRITAGGRSKDYSAGRGGYIADFSGFNGQSSDKICAEFNATTCTEINKRIISMIVAPKYDDICPPSPGQYPFSKVVAIDLPDNSKINGLVFEYAFLSNELNKEVYGILGTDFEKCYNPDPAIQKIFDDKVKEVLEKIVAKSLDQQTLNNIEGFDHFVNSIKFYK